MTTALPAGVAAPDDLSVRPPGLWKRAVLWLLLLAPLFFGTYGFATWATAQRADVGSVVFGWEHLIPLWPWTIVPYWSIDLLYGLSLLACATRRELDTHGRRLLTAQAIAVTCFLLFPLRFSVDRPAQDGMFGWMFDVLMGFDKPFNQAPSLHITLLVVLWVCFAAHSRGFWKLLVHGWFALIGLSVLTTWQHHFVDLPTGVLAGWLCVWLWPDHGPSPLARDRGATSLRAGPGWGAWPAAQGRNLLRTDHGPKDAGAAALAAGTAASAPGAAALGPGAAPLAAGDAPLASAQARRRLAWRYLAGAVVFAVLACLGGTALWLAWPALSLGLVALNYAWLGPAGFQKRADGSLSPAARWLFAPYLLAARINAAWWTRRHPHADAVADGVWLGPLRAWKAGASDAFAAEQDAADAYAAVEYAANQSATDRDATHEYAADEYAADQHATDRDAAHEYAADRDAADAHAANRDAATPESAGVILKTAARNALPTSQAPMFAGLVDMTAEIGADPAGRAYATFPVLDLTIPSVATCQAAADAIEQMRQRGPVLVACALGYSRSATAVAAWLLSTGRATSVDDAIAQLQRARPQIVLTAAHRAVLDAVLDAVGDAVLRMSKPSAAPLRSPSLPPNRPPETPHAV